MSSYVSMDYKEISNKVKAGHVITKDRISGSHWRRF